MANRTDASISAVSGSDPQNLFDYIIRTRIYDSRYWKETCFGLTVTGVLETAARACRSIGGHPTKFASLLLKLLQLHPESTLIAETFIQQSTFKYVRALGCLYIRLMSSHHNPVFVYDTLESILLQRDRRKLREYDPYTQQWGLIYMDEFIQSLLTQSIIVTLTLPRLPQRTGLVRAGYIAENEEYQDGDHFYFSESRPSALYPIILQHNKVSAEHQHDNDDAGRRKREYDMLLAFLAHKVQVDGSPAAQALWDQRQQQGLPLPEMASPYSSGVLNPMLRDTTGELQSVNDRGCKEPHTSNAEDVEASGVHIMKESKKDKKRKKEKKKEKQSFGMLFSSAKHQESTFSMNAPKENHEEAPPGPQDIVTNPTDKESEEYWNAERAKLGMKPLKK
jgi:pre-mRNA-splicing factor 38A